MSQHPRIGWFAREVLGKPLYWYQELIGDAIIDSVLTGQGHTFSVMMARQMGKNQLSAVLEAYFLFCMEQGSIIKAAPTYKPQIINSRLRLLSLCEAPLLRERIWKSFGYIIGCAPEAAQVEEQRGPRIMFFSAGPESNIVGATASILLEIDEAQDVAVEKYTIDLKPMASTTNSTIVMYGTAWAEDTLLARQRAHNLELEEQDGIQRHFEFDWRTLAAINPNYRRFVEAEMARLGEDHVAIRTQYRLLPIAGAGFLFNELQQHLLQGTHCWEDLPDEEAEGIYIAGLDVGGEERAKPGNMAKHMQRDSTVLTIGHVRYNDFSLPCIEIVHQCCWTGMLHSEQYAAVSEYLQSWNIRRLVIDKTGLGEALASLLLDRFGAERIFPYHFSRPSKSKLTYQLLSLINSGRIKLYAPEEAPPEILAECWKQLKLARYRVPGENLLDMYVDPSDGHDDFLLSLALCGEAIREFVIPSTASVIIRPAPLYCDGYF
ncbi:MAG TPA: hypothetical protein VL485_24085 [Ktedonobacteraceae bacterium]|jgi:hypothetical protein|nr:hypothetical protein [Ktedonobacteraceae bacterium]